MWCDWSNSTHAVPPCALLVAPVAEFARNDGIDVGADLRIPDHLHRVASGIQGLLEVLHCHADVSLFRHVIGLRPSAADSPARIGASIGRVDNRGIIVRRSSGREDPG